MNYEIFTVTITETLGRNVKIVAPNADETIELVRKQYADGEIVLGADDFIGVDIDVF